jgi:hypothetical protein
MSTTATLAFLLWPVVAAILYGSLPFGRATVWNFLGAQMILPSGAIKFEMILPFEKYSIPTLCALVATIMLRPSSLRFRSSLGLSDLLMLMYVVGPVLSSLSNGDTIAVGGRVLPSLGVYESLSAAEAAVISILPFFLGRQLLRNPADCENLLRILAIAGLVYSIPMLFEIRFSPQLHVWVYGYASHDFIQSMRDGGYRPVVFMGHGLLTTFFLMTTCVAAAALWRTRTRIFKLSPAAITVYLYALLILCRSAGNIIYGTFAVPLTRWGSPRNSAFVSLVLVSLALAYPMLRAQGFVPTNLIIETSEQLGSADRASSIGVRFKNEDELLERAAERPLFGWGRGGRSRLYDEGGSDASVTDGRWIITMGQFGIFGFVAEFGLLTLGVFRVFKSLRYVEGLREKVFLSSIGLIVAVNVVDLLPNSSITAFTFLVAGALVGQTESIKLRVARRYAAGRTGLSLEIKKQVTS